MSPTQPTPGGNRDQPETPAGRAVPDNLAASTAPMPTAHTVRMRTNVPFQGASGFSVGLLAVIRGSAA
jgi:hypothetical protein